MGSLSQGIERGREITVNESGGGINDDPFLCALQWDTW